MSEKRKQRTVEEGREIVRRLQRSGLTQEKFAEKLGISASVVCYWVRRLKDLHKAKKKSKVTFVEVVTPVSTPNSETSVELPGGISLKMSHLPEPSYLAELSVEYQRRSLC